jgi:hypothetical protein
MSRVTSSDSYGTTSSSRRALSGTSASAHFAAARSASEPAAHPASSSPERSGVVLASRSAIEVKVYVTPRTDWVRIMVLRSAMIGCGVGFHSTRRVAVCGAVRPRPQKTVSGISPSGVPPGPRTGTGAPAGSVPAVSHRYGAACGFGSMNMGLTSHLPSASA